MPQRALEPIPKGMHTLTIHLWFNGNCIEAVDFYQRAFGAKLIVPPVTAPDGDSVLHVMMRIGDSQLMMADGWPGAWERGPNKVATAGLWVYVDDCDALFKQATDAGCQVLMPLEDAFWGDRMGKVKDPYGHCWAIATHKWVFTPEEMKKRQQEWLKKLG